MAVEAHAVWLDGRLAVFAIDREAAAPVRAGSSRRPRRHPGAVEPATVLAVDGEIVELVLSEPTGTGPTAWSVPAVALAAGLALDALGELRHAGPSVQWFIAVGGLALDLVESAQVVPGLELDAQGTARARWWPLPTGATVERLQVLAAARPGVVAAAGDGSASPLETTAAVLGHLVDVACRQRVMGVRLTPAAARPRRDARERALGAWLDALVADDSALAARAGAPLHRPEVHALATDLAAWARLGLPAAGPVRLSLRVEPPLDGEDEDRWFVRYLQQSAAEASLVVELGDVWAGAPVAALLGVPLPELEDLALAGLGRAVAIAPELASSLDDPRPSGAALDAAAASTFLLQSAPLLEQAGVRVQLPSWWAKRGRLGARLRASTTSAAPVAVVGSGLSAQGIAEFQWEVAIGGAAMTAAELDELAALAEHKQAIVRVKGAWVELRADDIAAARQLLERPAADLSLSELMRMELGLGADDENGAVQLPVDDVIAEGWLRDLLDDVVAQRLDPITRPDGFNGTLRPYQARGVGWLTFLGRVGLGACLADDMGLGKTPQLLAHVLADRLERPTLVVAPTSVLGNWQREAARFAPDLDVYVHHGAARSTTAFVREVGAADLVLTTYNLVGRDIERFTAVEWGRLVLDEAQNVKNPNARQSQAVRRLRAARRVALTGTPVENRLSELWSIMNVLNPGLLGSAPAFRERFAVPIERHGDDAAASLLRTVTAPFVLRRLKTDRSIIDDLPEKLEMVERCHLTKEQISLYQAVLDEMLTKVDAAEGIERRGLVLATLLRLKQVCNHPAQLLGDGSALADRSGKLARTEELLAEILDAGDAALCFTQFAEWGHALQPYLTRRLGEEVLWLHGGVRKAKRDEMIDRFQSGHAKVFLLSLKAGGTGLTLTAASHVIHLDRWWNPAVEDQATDRAFRIGQHRNVQVRKLVCIGTVEERIDAIIEQKRALAEKVIGSGERWVTELSTDELRALVALSADALAEVA